MRTKLMIACMAIASIVAFVVAPAASASTLTENGSAVAVGSSFTGKAGEIRFIAGENTVTCSNASLSGTVTTNASGAVAGEIAAGNPSFTGTGSGGDCTSGLLGSVKPSVNSKLCLSVAKGTDIGSLTGCAGAPVTVTLFFTSTPFGPLTCRYERASFGIEITTSPADAAVRILFRELMIGEVINSLFCPAEIELEMEFTLTTTGGTTLLFS